MSTCHNTIRCRRLYPALILAGLVAAGCAGGANQAQTAPPDANTAPPESPGPGAGQTSSSPAFSDWKPEDTKGKFVPAPEAYYQPWDVEACGGTVTVATGDLRETEYKATRQEDGSMRLDFRGGLTLDVSRDSDGARLDELEASGPGYELRSPDGLTVVWSWDGPSLITAFDDVETTAFEKEGLPMMFYFTEGSIEGKSVSSEEPNSETVSAEITNNGAGNVQDVCRMLDDAAKTPPAGTNSP